MATAARAISPARVGGGGKIPLKKEKIFNDAVLGHVAIHPVCVAVIDTPEFQRLQKLNQLGPTQWVFPGATHKRFAHSIGVSYLAGRFVESIRRRQPELEITDADVLCVKLAGLCHDLGHGPLSHTYDGKFVRAARAGEEMTWQHEHTSAALLAHLVRKNALWPVLQAYALTQDDLHFAQELIFGACEEAPEGWAWRGRGDRGFLYEIVANHRNEIDVDKFDYFRRDCYHLGIPSSFDSERLMQFSRVVADDKGQRQIAYHEKEVWNVYELFRTRFNLHKRAYHHRVVHAVERMLCDALLLAERGGFTLHTEGGGAVKMSRAMEDLTAYSRLNDSVFDVIEDRAVREEALRPACDLLARVHARALYRHVGEVVVPTAKEALIDRALFSEDDLLAQIAALCDTPQETRALLDGAYVDRFALNYGMKAENPVDHVLFYLREDDTQGRHLRKEQVSSLVPSTFQEFYLRLYLKSRDDDVLHRVAQRALERWENDKFQRPGRGSAISPSPSRKKHRGGANETSTHTH